MRETELHDGRRALEVSALCLGTMMFGTTVDRATSFAILDRFVEAGGTFLDTANCYAFWAPDGSGGESEELLGEWLRRRGKRDDVRIATKLGAGPADPSRPYDAHNREGLAPEVVHEEVAGSLRRLGVDCVDLLYAHADDRSTPLRQTLQALAPHVADGSVGMLGASNYTAWRLALAQHIADRAGLPRFGAVQLRHTFLDPCPLRGAVTDEIQLPVTADLRDLVGADGRIGVLGYSPLLGGAYTRRDRALPEAYDHPGSPPRMRVLHDVAAELGVTPNQLVLAWMLHGDPPVLPVVGVSSVAQLDECLGALDVELDVPTLARLDG